MGLRKKNAPTDEQHDILQEQDLKRLQPLPRLATLLAFAWCVAVERLIDVSLEGLLRVPAREAAVELQPQVVQHQRFAQHLHRLRP